METYTCPICFEIFTEDTYIDKYYHKCDVKECINNNFGELKKKLGKFICWYCTDPFTDSEKFMVHMDFCEKKCKSAHSGRNKIKRQIKDIDIKINEKSTIRHKIIGKINKLLSRYLMTNMMSFDSVNINDIDLKIVRTIMNTEKYPIIGIVRALHCNRHNPKYMNMYCDNKIMHVYEKKRWKKYHVKHFLRKIVCLYITKIFEIIIQKELPITSESLYDLCVTQYKLLNEDTQMNEFIEKLKKVLSENKKILEKTRKNMRK
jgi:hypothetical protein